eukprot:Phypoly_transcript_11796.p1 GENE.Phypoly_transcript_11796~~Phypoly_transcript_11796.p1  ORF type:complete len:270 (+),score=2.99 Phypoly_transcript_11796:241-1050(+)
MDSIKTTMDPYVRQLASYTSRTRGRVLQINDNLQDQRHPLSLHKYLEPHYLLLVMVAYILLVVIVPRFRVKFHIAPWASLHHGISLLSCIFIPYYVITLAIQSNYKAICNFEPLTHDLFAKQLAHIYGSFYLFKIYELFDAVLAHLEKKRLTPSFHFFQITNVFFAWLAAYFAPYGDVYLPVVINSVVSGVLHATYVIRAVQTLAKVSSEFNPARPLMYIQCLLNLGLGIYEYINKCGYPETILLPFIGYNFLTLFYTLVTNTHHVKQD